MTRALVVLEGGGARGFGLASALQRAEAEVEIVGVAGTSAGAIVASLFAAYGDADRVIQALRRLVQTEILDPVDQALAGLAPGPLFARLTSPLRQIEALCARGLPRGVVGALGLIPGLYHAFRDDKVQRLVSCIVHNKGLYRGSQFHAWLERELQTGLSWQRQDRVVQFSDLRIPLKIVATDLGRQQVKVWSSTATPDASVSDAVRASMSIPFVFVPLTEHNTNYLVDGGLVSNFPAWVFDEELLDGDNVDYVLGFRLISRASRPAPVPDIQRWDQFLYSIFRSALRGNDRLQYRGVSSLQLVPIDTGAVGTLDFDLSDDDIEGLLKAGRYAFDNHFSRAGRLRYVPMPRRETLAGSVEPLLERCARGLVELTRQFGVTMHDQPVEHKCLRVLVIAPVDDASLQACYSWNTAGDIDARMTLGYHEGFVGKVMHEEPSAVVDINMCRAAPTYSNPAARQLGIPTYTVQQDTISKIRSQLQSALCVPIFSADNYRIGVLVFDSDDPLPVNHFAEDAVVEFASQCGHAVGRLFGRIDF